MRKNSLQSSGLSLSQAQSISNLCHQRALEINGKVTNVNNYSKTVEVKGKKLGIVVGKPLPENVLALLKEKAELHACQAFLMENIKAKDAMINAIKRSKPDLSVVKSPEYPEYLEPELLSQVDEEFGWEQLTDSELAEYYEAEAFAAHIGQFIHKGSTLDTLRSELPGLPAIEWMVIKDGEKSPVEIIKHHTSEELLKLHEELATVHREYEQKVNYFKAKVKNLTTAENARIANVNADAEADVEKTNSDVRTKYEMEIKKYHAELLKIKGEFEKERQSEIKRVAALRINVNPRFQSTIDKFLKQLPESQD